GPARTGDPGPDVILMSFAGRRGGKIRQPEQLASYVLGTCRRVVSAWQRGTRRRERLLENHGRELALSSGPEPLLDLDRLAGCLAGLSERERTVIVLSF